MISINMSATQWLPSACRGPVRLVDGPAKLRQQKSAHQQGSAFYAQAVFGPAASNAPARVAAFEVPAQQISKGDLRGPQPWRNSPVIT